MVRSAAKRWAGVLRGHDLRTLVLAFIIDGSASWSYIIVLTAYVYDRTHSAGWVTALVTVRWVTGMVIGGYAGVAWPTGTTGGKCCSAARSRRPVPPLSSC